MRKISIEEHFTTEEHLDQLNAILEKKYPIPDVIEEEKIISCEVPFLVPTRREEAVKRLLDIGDGRIKEMDEVGIDMQVLSLVSPGIQVFDAAKGTSLAKKINDQLSEAVSKHPERLAGFASLAPQDPGKAADELERAVKDLGFKGACINSHTKGEYLDEKKYWVIFEKAEELGVPIYIHPRSPSPDMVKPYLDYPMLTTAIIGFAAEVSLHALRLISSGLLPKYAFPVDVVSLSIPSLGRKTKDDDSGNRDADAMQRDLKIALAEYARAAGDDEILQRAKDLFKLIIRYHKTPGLLPPKVFPETRQAKAHAMPMILLATAQVFREAGADPFYDEVISDSIDEVLNHFVHPEDKALFETVGPNGERLDSPEGRLVNPGHAIETAWFLMEEARQRDDRALVEKACQILDWSLELGWDKKYGGMLSIVDIEGKPPMAYHHDMKFWWPHNEAIYATLLAHHLTGRPEYIEWHGTIHDWAHAHFPDSKNGEWFGYLHRDGTVSSAVKGDFFKGPFHVPRMQLNCWKLLDEMLAGASRTESA